MVARTTFFFFFLLHFIKSPKWQEKFFIYGPWWRGGRGEGEGDSSRAMCESLEQNLLKVQFESFNLDCLCQRTSFIQSCSNDNNSIFPYETIKLFSIFRVIDQVRCIRERSELSLCLNYYLKYLTNLVFRYYVTK